MYGIGSVYYTDSLVYYPNRFDLSAKYHELHAVLRQTQIQLHHSQSGARRMVFQVRMVHNILRL